MSVFRNFVVRDIINDVEQAEAVRGAGLEIKSRQIAFVAFMVSCLQRVAILEAPKRSFSPRHPWHGLVPRTADCLGGPRQPRTCSRLTYIHTLYIRTHIHTCIHTCIGTCARTRVRACIHKGVSGRLSVCRPVWHGWMDGWMDGWMGAWMHGWMDGWVGGWVDGYMDTWMAWHGWMDGWMDGCMGAWMHGCMDGWMNECMNA